MKLFSHIPSWVKNKFFLATIVFIVWMLFFDRNDIFTQYSRRQDLNDIKKSSIYFSQQIDAERKFANELKNDPTAIEKLAREKYLMKRDNEELFLIKTEEK